MDQALRWKAERGRKPWTPKNHPGTKHEEVGNAPSSKNGLKMKYRVHYPICHDNHYRDFLTRAEAEKFARERQKIVDLSPAYLNIHSWPTIWIEEIK
jgi:hypothetical protein